MPAKKTIPLVLLLLAASLSTPRAEEPMGAAPPAPLPAKPPELELLKQFIGTWETDAHNKVAIWTPMESRVTGTVTNEFILDGRFVQGKGSNTRFQYLAHWTYDAPKKVFRTWFFNSLGHANEFRGVWDEASHSFQMKGEINASVEGILTVRFVDKDTIEWHGKSTDKEGKVYYEMVVKWMRKK